MTDIVKRNPYDIIESAIVRGDLSELSASERTAYYLKVCESVGLNPLTKPFEFIKLNGREVLYTTRSATDQLRAIHGVSVRITARERMDDVYVVTASATNRDGRIDESTGAVVVGNLKGEALANALMKAETKAKRRVTLCICGLGMLDESELDTLPTSGIDVAHVSATAEDQARRRNDDARFAEELIAMFPSINDADELFAWVHHHGHAVHRMESNAKGKLWRALQKRIQEANINIPVQDLKRAFADAPAPMESEEA